MRIIITILARGLIGRSLLVHGRVIVGIRVHDKIRRKAKGDDGGKRETTILLTMYWYILRT